MNKVNMVPGTMLRGNHYNIGCTYEINILETYLRNKQISSVVITGLSTQHCVSTTTRMSSNLGFETFLVDATAAFDITDHHATYFAPEDVHKFELAVLHKEFATITETNDILSQL